VPIIGITITYTELVVFNLVVILELFSDITSVVKFVIICLSSYFICTYNLINVLFQGNIPEKNSYISTVNQIQ
jgi:hypothetical protein